MSEEIMVETSARHVHVSREALDILYGEGYELTPKKWLSQPGQFASEERVRVIGTKGEFPAVSILGPVRPASQVELSATDCRSIGLGIVVRESGDIDGTPGCTIVGPKGEVTIDKGVIVAKRHIHMTPEDAEHYGVTDKQIVSVKVDSADRSLIFGDVVVRVRSDFKLAMHIDTDESNAVLAARDAVGTIIK
ncbi:MAG: phosphate propanoyltransferase [Clostridiales bacterium]|nr:phosphate propanoyltransferase [Clostridiales bacterium]